MSWSPKRTSSSAATWSGAAFPAVTLEAGNGAGTRALTDNYLDVRIAEQSLTPGLPVSIELTSCDVTSTSARLV